MRRSASHRFFFSEEEVVKALLDMLAARGVDTAELEKHAGLESIPGGGFTLGYSETIDL